MNRTDTTDSADTAAHARHVRFGSLPELIPYSAMVEEVPATPQAGDGFDPERSWLYHSCIALDLGIQKEREF